VTFQFPKGASAKVTVMCDVAPCSLVEIDRRFRGVSGFHREEDDSPDDERVSASETSVSFYTD
jgi:hypothetical protein